VYPSRGAGHPLYRSQPSSSNRPPPKQQPTPTPPPKGVWTKDLKIRTNLGQQQLSKIFKALEARGLIKSIKAVTNPTRKLVMLAELEPSKEVTGGAW
jgi:hypothetical protein